MVLWVRRQTKKERNLIMSKNRNSQLIKRTRIEPVGQALFTWNPIQGSTTTPREVTMQFIIDQIKNVVGNKSFVFKINSFTYFGIRGGNSIAAKDAINRDILSDNVANIIDMPLFAFLTNIEGNNIYIDPKAWTVYSSSLTNQYVKAKIGEFQGKLPNSTNESSPVNLVRCEISVSYFVI